MLRNVASQKYRVYAWDVTTGLPKTGDAANISAYITKDDGTPAATNDAAPTEVDSTNEKGFYDFSLLQAESDAAKVSLSPKSSTSNVVVIACPPVVYTRPQYFSVMGVESDGMAHADVKEWLGTAPAAYSTTRGTAGTALPNAAADAAGGLIISDAGGFDIDNRAPAAAAVTNLNTVFNTDFASAYDATNNMFYTNTLFWSGVSTDSGQIAVKSTLAKTTHITGFNDIAATAIVSGGAITTSGGAVSTVTTTVNLTTNNDKTGYRLSATGVDDIWDEAQSGHATAGTFGLYLDSAVSGVSTGGVSAADIADAVWDEATSGHTTAGTFGKAAADILDDTGTSGVVVAAGSKTGYSITGTTTTFDALQTALNSAHGAGSWATATGFSTHSASDVWAVGTRALTDKAGFTISGTITTLDALDTAQDSQHSTTQTAISALNNLSSAQAQTAVTAALNAALTEAYRTAGATGSVAQLLYEISAHLGRAAISSTTKTLKKVDGSTTAKTYTLDSATTPTSITEAT